MYKVLDNILFKADDEHRRAIRIRAIPYSSDRSQCRNSPLPLARRGHKHGVALDVLDARAPASGMNTGNWSGVFNRAQLSFEASLPEHKTGS